MAFTPTPSTRLVRVTHVSPGYDPVTFYEDLIYDAERPKIQEIEMIEGDAPKGYGRTGTMYCFVNSDADAEFLRDKLSGHIHGKQHLLSTMEASIVPVTEAPGEKTLKRLSDFLRVKKTIPKTKTVLFEGLPPAHPHAFIRDLFNEANFSLGAGGYDDMDEGQKSAHEYIEYIKDRGERGEEFLVRFKDVGTAMDMVVEYNGTYHKNGTIYLTCVANDELDVVVPPKEDKQVQLFIPKVKPNASRQDIVGLFAPHVPSDVQMNPGTPFAFVYMHPMPASAFMHSYEQTMSKYGQFRYKGWNYTINWGKKNKGNNKKSAYAAPSAEFKAVPTSGPIDEDTYGGFSNIPVEVAAPVKQIGAQKDGPAPVPTPASSQGPVKVGVNGVPYAATEDHVRTMFSNAQFEVLELDLNKNTKDNIHAVVKLASQSEAQRAISTLSGRSLVGRKGPKSLKVPIQVMKES